MLIRTSLSGCAAAFRHLPRLLQSTMKCTSSITHHHHCSLITRRYNSSSSGVPPPSADKPPPTDQMKRRSNMRDNMVTWKSALFAIAMCGGVLALYVYMKQQRAELIEKKKRARIGKTLIGGPWQLVNHKGVTQSHEDYKGNWLLIYFGFTHCPDICPDEIEKMCKVVEMLQADKDHKEPIIPLFMSVDPARDTPERVRAYISDFSPQLVGFTGSVEQVAQAAKTFRVYHSQGPGSKDAPADYIVDHTVIIYLMDPEGKFVDYYGQNRTAQEIAEVIRLQIFKYEQARRKGKSTSWWPNSLF